MKGTMMKNLGITLSSLFLVVQRGCGGEAELTVAIGTNAAQQTAKNWSKPGYVCQCLETNPEEVSGLRERIRAAGVYGTVTARLYDGSRLLFIDNSVNRLVSSDSEVTSEEILRVLVPGGVAMIDGREDHQAVARGDRRLVALPPQRRREPWSAATRWSVRRGGFSGSARPKWLRNHDFMSSMHAMVSSGGRVFYIIDEGCGTTSSCPRTGS